MQFTTAIATLAASLPALTTALDFNKTQAYAPGNFDKYKCITTEKVNDLLPKCMHSCQRTANLKDSVCPYDDIACHCVNYNEYSPLVESCAFPPELGGNGTCTLDQLSEVRGTVQDVCNFLNATLYTAQTDCDAVYSPLSTFKLIEDQEITILDQ